MSHVANFVVCISILGKGLCLFDYTLFWVAKG